MLNYVILVALGISAFWLLYHLFFRNRAAPGTNRAFLLAGLVLPFLMPLVSLPSLALSAVEPILLPAVDLGKNSSSNIDSSNTNSLLTWLYLGGLLAISFYYLTGLLQLLRLIGKAKKLAPFNHVYLVPQNVMPFSFAGKICLPQNLLPQQQQTVLAHEQWHLKCYHSLDVLWAIIVQTALWFFPLLPFYLKDLKTEHEYEVDAKMLANHKLSQYAETLLHLSLSPVQGPSWHSFSSPNLKNRILMMTKNTQRNSYKLLFILPVAASLLYLNACSKQEGNQELAAPKTLSMAEVDVFPQFTSCAQVLTPKEQQLCFSQGMQELVLKNFNYPEVAKNERLEARIYVGFTINHLGEIVDPTLKRGAEGDTPGAEALNQEALQIFNNVPKLKPAFKDGHPVKVTYTLPIAFRL
jgi:TonB family protein